MMADKALKSITSFEEGWPLVQDAVNKLIDHLEGIQNYQFTSEDYMIIYTTVYNMAGSNPAGPESQKLYDQYQNTFEDYITRKVLPSLRGKKDEDLLQELVKRWDNHKVMTRWLSRFFNYLSRYFLSVKKLPTLLATSHLAFYTLIDQQREGEHINQGLVRKVLDIYVEMAEDSMKYYEKDFEEAMLKDTAAFYSKKASNWISSDSYEDYMLKVDGCFKSEEDSFSIPEIPKQI